MGQWRGRWVIGGVCGGLLLKALTHDDMLLNVDAILSNLETCGNVYLVC